jgi:hypothetical protein
MDTAILFLMGALGAFVKDIFKDNYIVLPKFKEGKLFLGCIGGLVIGAMAGYIADNDPLTAFLGGFAGYQLIESLLPKKESITPPPVFRQVIDTKKKVSAVKEVK